MRPSTLRALLRELRAGGVSEYSATKRGETVTLKLGSAPAATVKRPSVPADAQPFVSSALRSQLEDLGVNVDEAAEVIRSVGIGSDGGS